MFHVNIRSLAGLGRLGDFGLFVQIARNVEDFR